MVRITGSVKDENSVSAPTGDSLSSVVRRRRGNSAKRMSGTESRAPTKSPPTESNAPRKERLLSGDSAESEVEMPLAECPACSTMPSPSASSDHGTLPLATVELPGYLFLFGECPEVSHQFRYIVGLDLRTEGRHLSSALGDHFSQLRIGLLLNFGRAQIFRMECLAGGVVAAAIGAMTQGAVHFKNFGGIGLGLHRGWQSHAAQDTCWNQVQRKLSHMIS